MHIVVLIKQVPAVNEVRFNPETRTIVREGVSLLMNSLDRRALTQALKLRDQLGGTVTAVSMGPPQARSVLVEALATGADRAVHLLDRAFAGADTLATARTLAAALKRLEPDLVIGGRFSIDAETGQVGPEVAELLDIPQATNVRRVEPLEDGRTLRVERETDDALETLELRLPCLLTAGEFLITPVRPTPEQVEAAKDRPVETWGLADVGLPADQVGLAGSPTSVSEIRELKPQRECRVVDGDDPQAAARTVAGYLLERGLFTPWRREQAGAPSSLSQPPQHRDGAVWVVAERSGGRLRGVTLELLGKGAELAAARRTELAAVVFGDAPDTHLPALSSYGVHRAYLAAGPHLERYATEPYAAVLAAAIQEYRPAMVLFGATVNGRDLAPRVAARLGLGLTGDCIGLDLDPERRLLQLKPAFGGNIVAPILSRTSPAMATVRPGMLPRPQAGQEGRVAVERLNVDGAREPRVRLVGYEPVTDETGVKVDEAEVVVSAGAGIQSADNVPLLQDLASVMGGTVAASLRAVAAGLLPGPLQIGLTGRSISPRFYVAIAIRGTLNHMIGVQKAETIVAINNDPAADIFKACDMGVIGDFKTVVPALTEALRRAAPARGK